MQKINDVEVKEDIQPLNNVLEFYCKGEELMREDIPMKDSKWEEIFKIAKSVEENMIKMPVPEVGFK